MFLKQRKSSLVNHIISLLVICWKRTFLRRVTCESHFYFLKINKWWFFLTFLKFLGGRKHIFDKATEPLSSWAVTVYQFRTPVGWWKESECASESCAEDLWRKQSCSCNGCSQKSRRESERTTCTCVSACWPQSRAQINTTFWRRVVPQQRCTHVFARTRHRHRGLSAPYHAHTTPKSKYVYNESDNFFDLLRSSPPARHKCFSAAVDQNTCVGGRVPLNSNREIYL